MIDNEKNVLNSYQDWVWTTTSPSAKVGDHSMWWASSGLAAESGEVLALFEKAYRKGETVNRARLVDELGDCFWFLVSICNMADIDINDVLTMNVQKINARLADGKLTSEG